MLRFDVYRDDGPAGRIDLAGAYVFGQGGIPVRADIVADKGQISCMKRSSGACGLMLLWDAGKPGKMLLPTTRLPDRKAPYNLNVELTRARVMQLIQKREDWGLFDYDKAQALNSEFEGVRRLFISSLNCDDPAKAAVAADDALAKAIVLSEKITLFHGDIFLNRRRQSTSAGRAGFGCVVDLLSGNQRYRQRLASGFDFVSIPVSWKHLAPKERSYKWEHVDDWINWAAANRRPVHAGPLVSFDPADVPEWLYLWEYDYEAIRDMIYEHIQRVVQRYEPKLRLWRVACGLHAHNSFNMSFEQIMELTRMSCSLVKKLAPKSVVLIDLVFPWGEYYARNQRTIPPMLYAGMAVQSGIRFDAFGVQVYMGAPQDGMYVRDFMQISAMLDEFVGFGVPLEITGVQAPSNVSADKWDAWGGQKLARDAGHWHAPWNPRLQAEWLQAFYRTAISKPFVESVCWRDLADYEGHYLPHGGLCHSNMRGKLSFKELRSFRSSMRPADESVPDQDEPIEADET